MSAISRLLPRLPLAAGLVAAVWAASGGMLSAASDKAQQPLSIHVRDLGVIGPGNLTHGRAINNRGHVAGNGLSPTSMHVPFLWTPKDGFTLIIGDTPGQAFDINERDEIVGAFGETGEGNGFLWSPRTGLTDLGPQFRPRAINEKRQIAGVCVETDGARNVYPACLWEDGLVTTRLNIGFGPSDSVTGINARGDVVGYSDRGWVWTARRGPLALPLSFVFGINNRGHIAAWEYLGLPGALSAVLTRTGQVVRRAPSDAFVPRAINARDWVVGSANQAASLWHPRRGIVTLPQAEPYSEANDINERGQITGFAQLADGSVHAMIWTVRGAAKQSR